MLSFGLIAYFFIIPFDLFFCIILMVDLGFINYDLTYCNQPSSNIIPPYVY